MSWVFNLLNPSQVSHLVPIGDQGGDVYTDIEQHGSEDAVTIQRKRKQKHTEPMDEEEEAARAPYWHVSPAQNLSVDGA